MLKISNCCISLLLGFAVEAADRMVGYEETSFEEIGSWDTNFSILKTKELVDLDVVLRNSMGSYILVLVAKVGATMF